MSTSPDLHPSVRENIAPKISAASLAQYLILRPDEQDKVLHNSRFSKQPIVAANAAALNALTAYNRDVRRPRSLLDSVKATLTAKAADRTLRPKAQDEARRCAEIIELFERAENALGLSKLRLIEPPKFGDMTIEGVTVMLRPHFIWDATGPKGVRRVGAGLLRVAKAPDPASCKLEATRLERGDHRREMARYMVAMLQLLLEEQWPDRSEVDRDLCFVADVRLGERIGPARDHSTRIRAIKAACGQVARLWDSVKPGRSVLRK
jgi:hypothetical protein